MPDDSDLIHVARRVVEEALGVKPGEQALIVTDFDRPPSITNALRDCARRAGAEVVVAAMAPRDHGGIDPPTSVGAAITASHAVVMQTSFATIHTKTLRGAMAQGVRICEFWGVTKPQAIGRHILFGDDAGAQLQPAPMSAMSFGPELQCS